MKTQALGWLAAGVLAAGLNASYHDGGLEWAHRIADRVEHRTNAVLALATGNADRFLTEAQVISLHTETPSSPLAAIQADSDADAEGDVADSDIALANVTAFSDRQQAQLDRLEAQREQIEAAVRIPVAAVRSVTLRLPKVEICPRVRVNVKVPRIPQVRMPEMPRLHSSGPA
jgi:hypothetical protein